MPNLNDSTSNVAHKIKDSDLVFLVNIVNKTGASIGMTLLTKGSMLTGQLISGKEYYEFVANEMKQSGEAGVALSAYFSTKAETMYTPAEGEEAPNGFLHLKNVKTRSPEGNLLALNDAYLRMKLEEIDGHIIGTMS